MADHGGPDRDLERARLRLEVSQQQTNIVASEYRLLQLQTESRKVQENLEAARQAIAERQAALTALESEPADQAG